MHRSLTAAVAAAVSERDAAREGLRKACDELMICGSKQSDRIRSKYLGDV